MMANKKKLKTKIMELLQERGPEKTICPSEGARAVAPAEWRPLMEPTRQAAAQ